MRKTYVLDQLDEQKLQEFMNLSDSVNKDDQFVIIVDSFGGPQTFFCMVSDRLNEMLSEGLDVSLVILTAGSMALQLAWEFEGKKRLARFCEGVAHTVAQSDSATFYVNGETRIRTTDPVRIGRAKEDATRNPFDYPFLTESEKADYLSGLDVYLSETRMKEIFAK